jgi:hypothetical protein
MYQKDGESTIIPFLLLQIFFPQVQVESEFVNPNATVLQAEEVMTRVRRQLGDSNVAMR